MNERCASIEELSAYLDDELPINQMRRVHRHLAACTSCSEHAENLRQVSSFVSALPDPAMPGDMAARLREQIGSRNHQSTRHPILGCHPWSLLPLSMAATLVLTIGVLLGNALVDVNKGQTPAQYPMARFDVVLPGEACVNLYDCYRTGIF